MTGEARTELMVEVGQQPRFLVGEGGSELADPVAHDVDRHFRVELGGIGRAADAEGLDWAGAAGRQGNGIGDIAHRLEMVLERGDIAAESGKHRVAHSIRRHVHGVEAGFQALHPIDLATEGAGDDLRAEADAEHRPVRRREIADQLHGLAEEGILAGIVCAHRSAQHEESGIVSWLGWDAWIGERRVGGVALDRHQRVIDRAFADQGFADQARGRSRIRYDHQEFAHGKFGSEAF